MKNKQLLEKKKLALSKAIEKNQEFETRSIYFQIHSIIFKISTESDTLLTQISEEYEIIENEKESFNIIHYNPEVFSIPSSEWEDEESSDCLTEGNITIQRDFAINSKEANIIAIFDSNNNDGLYNLLRFLLPHFFLKKNIYLIHSSAVVFNDKAKLFLGQSGAGKTTVTKFSEKHIVCSDDMNVLIEEDGKFYVKNAGVGGLIKASEKNGKYLLDEIFWITQSKEDRLQELSSIEKTKKLLMSFANLDWKKINKCEEEIILNVIGRIVEKIPMKEMFFTKSQNFLRHFSE